MQLHSPDALEQQIIKLVAHKLGRAVECLGAPPQSPADGSFREDGWDEQVHDTRKTLKRIRSVLRALGTAVDPTDFARLDGSLASAGSLLGPWREAGVFGDRLLTIARELTSVAPEHSNPDFAPRLIQTLDARRRAVHAKLPPNALKREATDALHAALEELQTLRVRACPWELMSQALAKTYRQARKRQRTATKSGDHRDYHRFRKSVKYHLHQLELIRPLWPELIEVEAAEAHELADLLGEDHDLADIKQALPELLAAWSANERDILQAAITQASTRIRTRIPAPAAKLLAEPSRAWQHRHDAYFSVWRCPT